MGLMNDPRETAMTKRVKPMGGSPEQAAKRAAKRAKRKAKRQERKASSDPPKRGHSDG